MGYVSPQYHMVFNDKFDTVFHDDMSSDELDNICDEFFVNSCDCHAEEEYDNDGILIYNPSLLDEVWLSELEWHEQRQELEWQCTCAVHRRDLETC